MSCGFFSSILPDFLPYVRISQSEALELEDSSTLIRKLALLVLVLVITEPLTD